MNAVTRARKHILLSTVSLLLRILGYRPPVHEGLGNRLNLDVSLEIISYLTIYERCAQLPAVSRDTRALADHRFFWASVIDRSHIVARVINPKRYYRSHPEHRLVPINRPRNTPGKREDIRYNLDFHLYVREFIFYQAFCTASTIIGACLLYSMYHGHRFYLSPLEALATTPIGAAVMYSPRVLAIFCCCPYRADNDGMFLLAMSTIIGISVSAWIGEAIAQAHGLVGRDSGGNDKTLNALVAQLLGLTVMIVALLLLAGSLDYVKFFERFEGLRNACVNYLVPCQVSLRSELTQEATDVVQSIAGITSSPLIGNSHFSVQNSGLHTGGYAEYTGGDTEANFAFVEMVNRL